MKNWKNNQEVSDEPKYRLSMHSSFIPKIQTNASLQQLYKSQQLNSILRKGSVKTSETQRRISSSEKSLNLSSIKVQAKNDQQTINFDQSGNNFNKTSNSFKLQKDYVGSLKTRVKQLQKDDIQNQIKLQAAQRELALVRDHDNEMNIKLQSIESLLSNKLQSDDKTDRTINQIEMENIQLKLMKKQFEDQIIQKNHFIKEFKRLEKTYQNKIQELESNNKTLQLQNKELMKFSQTNKNYQDEQITIQNSLKLQIEELKENNQLLIQVLAVREKTIEEHNKQIQQKEESHQLKIQLQFKEKENLNNLYDIEQQKVLSLQQEIEKLNNLEQYRQHMDKKITQLNEKQVNFDKKKVPSIQKSDVQQLGKILQFMIRDSNIDINQIEKNLFTTEQLQKGKASILNLMETMADSPFNIESEQDRTLIARYLVEDNKHTHIIQDFNQTQDILVIKSVFKNMIGDFKVLSEQQDQTLLKEISQILHKFKWSLIDTAESYALKRKKSYDGVVLIDELKSSLDYCGINFTQQQNDYFYFRLFQDSKKIDQINIEVVFKIFKL